MPNWPPSPRTPAPRGASLSTCAAARCGRRRARRSARRVQHAVDVDPAAVACARRNIGGSGQVHAGNLYEPLPSGLRGRVELLVANAPYVPTAEIALMPADRLHEPLVALDGGPDRTQIHRQIVAQAPDWLSPGGHLLIETSERQAPITAGGGRCGWADSAVVTCEDWSTAVVGWAPAPG